MDERQPVVTMEMLTPAQADIAEVIGLDAYVALTQYIDGDSIYIPKFEKLFNQASRIERDREIIDKFDGFNFKALAEEYGLVKRTLYNIIPPSVRKRKRSMIPGQLGFDGDDGEQLELK